MTVGEYPDGVPARWRIDPKVFASEYDLKRFTDVAGGLGLDVDDLAGGVIAEDFDGDGYLDLMCSSMHWQGQLRYFRNGRDGTFSERTHEAGLLGEVGGLNILHADYNNDGFPDVLVLRGLTWGPKHGYAVARWIESSVLTIRGSIAAAAVRARRSMSTRATRARISRARRRAVAPNLARRKARGTSARTRALDTRSGRSRRNSMSAADSGSRTTSFTSADESR